MLEHEKWLNVAQEDLMVAKALLKHEFFGAVTYHCQQAAEKALKGYLVFKKHEMLKTHDLIKLTKSCVTFDRSFEKLYEIVEQLNPFATKFRYPSEFEIPDLADAELVIKQTQMVVRFVLKKIANPVPETGQTSLFDTD